MSETNTSAEASMTNYDPLWTLSREEVDRCSFSSWYPSLAKYSIASRIIPLSSEFVEYLLDGGPMVLPKTSQDADDDDDDDDEDASAQQAPSFPDLESRVAKCIRQLGGRVLPKLNWSAPQDASWISTYQNLCCESFLDVVTLLKASENTTFDLTMAYKHCHDRDSGSAAPETPELVLKNWFGINPPFEFRCFVVNKQLIAVTQRHPDQYHEQLSSMRDEILTDVSSLFESLSIKFPLQKYCFDIYWERKGKVWLIDINPLHQMTELGLFTHEDLESLAETFERAHEDESGASPEQVVAHIEEKERPDAVAKSNRFLLSSLLTRMESSHESLAPFSALSTVHMQGRDNDDDDDDGFDGFDEQEVAGTSSASTMTVASSNQDANASALISEIEEKEKPDAVAKTNRFLLSSLLKRMDASDTSVAPFSTATPVEADGSEDDEFAESDEYGHGGNGESFSIASGSDSEDSFESTFCGIAFRTAETTTPMSGAKFALSAFPRDVVEIAGARDAEAMVQMMVRAMAGDSDDSDEGEDDQGGDQGAGSQDAGRDGTRTTTPANDDHRPGH